MIGVHLDLENAGEKARFDAASEQHGGAGNLVFRKPESNSGAILFSIGEASRRRNDRLSDAPASVEIGSALVARQSETRRDGLFCANSCAKSLDRIQIHPSSLCLTLSQNRSVRMALSWLKGL